jgi:ABC-type sugar transport system ATPase subunit
VHAIAGENGVGKSTLMKILSGVIGDYDGTIEIDGEPRRGGLATTGSSRRLRRVSKALSSIGRPDVAEAANG